MLSCNVISSLVYSKAFQVGKSVFINFSLSSLMMTGYDEAQKVAASFKPSCTQTLEGDQKRSGWARGSIKTFKEEQRES